MLTLLQPAPKGLAVDELILANVLLQASPEPKASAVQWENHPPTPLPTQPLVVVGCQNTTY